MKKKSQLIEKLRASTIFVGSDESWKNQHGDNWESKKQEYMESAQKLKDKILRKY